jgi:hypothetical protein
MQSFSVDDLQMHPEALATSAQAGQLARKPGTDHGFYYWHGKPWSVTDYAITMIQLLKKPDDYAMTIQQS